MDTARAQTSRLLDLLHREQGAMADFLVALAGFDRQRLWVGMGYTSLFYYLRRELKLSAGSAFLRKTAAELLQRFPEVEAPLRDGRLCLSSVAELAKVMTPENRAEVLPRFFYASKNEAKELAAEIAPRKAVPQRVVVTMVAPRALTSPAACVGAELNVQGGAKLALSSPALLPGETRQTQVDSAATLAFGAVVLPGETGAVAAPTAPRGAPAAGWAAAVPAPVPPPSNPRSSAEPLTATQHRLHATVSKEFLRKLAAAKDALSHSLPGADEAAILEAGLDLILEQAAKRKGLVKRPREAPPHAPTEEASQPNLPESRHIPAAVRRAVWTRDGGRCAWPTADGGVCGSTHRLQFDHIVPVANGGKSTVHGLRLCCAMHNDLAARQVFGDGWMDRYTRGAGKRGVASPPSPSAAPLGGPTGRCGWTPAPHGRGDA